MTTRTQVPFGAAGEGGAFTTTAVPTAGAHASTVGLPEDRWLTPAEKQGRESALQTLHALHDAIHHERIALDQAKFDTFIARMAGVQVEQATAALDDMFRWYDDYVARRATLDRYLEALDVIETWASDPTQVPEPLPRVIPVP